MDKSSVGKILIVDDDKDIQEIYSEVLTDEGYSVEVSGNGADGYTKISQGGYDLVLLDIMMPKMDGISVLRKLQNNPSSAYNGPIFVLSQLNNPEMIDQAMALGAKGYFVKSDMTPDELLERIAKILSKSTLT